MYWKYHELIIIKDDNFPASLDGVHQYCQYIANEYETLKAFAVNSYSTVYDTATLNLTVPRVVESGAFYHMYTNDNSFLSYIARNDW